MLNRVNEALDALKAGKMIIVIDDEDREAEGDFVCAAECCTPEMINFMARYGRGLICTALTEERIDQLNLPMMVQTNTSQHETAFTVSVDARKNTTTGISAWDRSITSIRLADSSFSATDFVTPGHSFPLKARNGGVLVRAGHTEAAVDLARLAGFAPAGVICEIMNEDGTMARMTQLRAIADEHQMMMISVEDLIAYRRQTEKLVTRVLEKEVKTRFGIFTLKIYRDSVAQNEHLVFQKGEISPDKVTLVRVQVENTLEDTFGIEGDIFSSKFEAGLSRIQEEGGVFLYFRSLDNPLNMWNKYLGNLEEDALDEEKSHHRYDTRNLGLGSQILVDLGISKIRLLSSSGIPRTGLKGFGLEVVDTEAL